jgi:Spy/CpxP family protein refolding chaperone
MMRSLAALLVCFAFALSASADEEKDPEFLKHFFGPELVLQHATAIGLTKEQRGTLMKDIGRVTGATTELQLSMIEQLGELEVISAADPIDERALVAAIHQVLLAENQVKEAHMGLLARVRNSLTPEQREKLRKIRDGA